MKRIPFYVALAVLCLAMTDCTSKKKMEIKMIPYPQTAKVVASMASEEALRIACGRQDLCTKGVVYYDGADGSVRTISLNVDPRCSNHEGERWKQTLKSLMQGTGRL